MITIDIAHHKRAGRGLKKPYLAFLRPDGHGSFRRDFVKAIKRGNNQKAFVANLRSGDVIEFRHTYWGEKSYTEQGILTAVDEFARAIAGAKPVGIFVNHAEGGTRWMTMIGTGLRVISREQAVSLAIRPSLAGEIASHNLPMKPSIEPMIAGVRFIKTEPMKLRMLSDV